MILREIIDGVAAPKRSLSGGLQLQFRQTDAENRLLVYRAGGKPPSPLEYAVVRRNLEAVVGEVTLEAEIRYTASDGRARVGRPFVWPRDDAATQGALWWAA